jgi:hypothetical protein
LKTHVAVAGLRLPKRSLLWFRNTPPRIGFNPDFQLNNERGANRSAELTTKPGAVKTPDWFSFKALFWCLARLLHWLYVDMQRSDSLLPSQRQKRIVFAVEGLLMARDFPFNCGIRVQGPAVDFEPEK